MVFLVPYSMWRTNVQLVRHNISSVTSSTGESVYIVDKLYIETMQAWGYMPLQSWNFLKCCWIFALEQGTVARQVTKLSGCSTHSLCAMLFSCNLFDRFWSCCSPLTSSTTFRSIADQLTGSAVRGSKQAILTLCIWSIVSAEQYANVSSDSLLSHNAAVEAWQACAIMLPRGHLRLSQRSFLNTTYCTRSSAARAETVGSAPNVVAEIVALVVCAADIQ